MRIYALSSEDPAYVAGARYAICKPAWAEWEGDRVAVAYSKWAEWEDAVEAAMTGRGVFSTRPDGLKIDETWGFLPIEVES